MDKMPEDLRWLAENVTEWTAPRHARIAKQGDEAWFLRKPTNCGQSFTFDQWQTARQQLEDDRMDRIGQNGNDGAHYDVIMTEEEESEYKPCPPHPEEVAGANEWDGETWPIPVGSACLCDFCGTWKTGHVIAHARRENGVDCIFEADGDWDFHGSINGFRPIRTKAERDRKELESTLVRWKDSTVDVVAGILIDNGWKKDDDND